MKRASFVFALGLLIAPIGEAQDLTPVWTTTIKDGGSVLPILISKSRTGTVDGDGNFTEAGTWSDGTRTMDQYTGLRRFDDDLLLLGVYNNGINENDPADNLALAAQFPDFSLLWIEESTGRPLGVALNLRDDIEANGAFFYSFDVDDDGNVYVLSGANLLRYAPDGSGGFGSAEVILAGDDILLEGETGLDENLSTFGVEGSGASTRINFGSPNGRIIETTDGNNFEITSTYNRAGWPPIGGCSTEITTGPGTALDEWIYTSGYGNNSNGSDSVFYRIFRPLDDPGAEWADDSEFFNAQGKPEAGELEYTRHFIGDVGTADGLPYLVAYSTPPWDSTLPQSPIFLALHDVSESAAGGVDGAYISDISIDVTTSDELRQPQTGSTVASWYGTEGTLEVIIPDGAADGASEVLWCGTVYGYGRFVVGSTSISDWSVH